MTMHKIEAHRPEAQTAKIMTDNIAQRRAVGFLN